MLQLGVSDLPMVQLWSEFRRNCAWNYEFSRSEIMACNELLSKGLGSGRGWGGIPSSQAATSSWTLCYAAGSKLQETVNFLSFCEPPFDPSKEGRP